MPLPSPATLRTAARRGLPRRLTTLLAVGLLAAACAGEADGGAGGDVPLAVAPVTVAPEPEPTATRWSDLPDRLDAAVDSARLEQARRTARAAVPSAAEVAATRPRPAADPVHLSIPALGVTSDLLHLDLRGDEPEVPEAFDVAGWYRQTVEPGTAGPAVVVGHVGSRNGPGIFAELDRLRPGDQIEVTDTDGVLRTFVVDRGALVDKYDRPPDVFGYGQDRPELRLITCGGDFDPSAGHHVSNYVIWAHQVDWAG